MGHHSEVASASSCGGTSAHRVTTVGGTVVWGRPIDEQTRCVHYDGPLDVVAMEFACCGEWYPCHLCHQEVAGHDAQTWPTDRRDREAVVCGVCGSRLRVDTYLEVEACPTCGSGFNPGCRLHYHLYFD